MDNWYSYQGFSDETTINDPSKMRQVLRKNAVFLVFLSTKMGPLKGTLYIYIYIHIWFLSLFVYNPSCDNTCLVKLLFQNTNGHLNIYIYIFYITITITAA